MSSYLGSLRDQRPIAADALEMVTDDLATRLVPFPRFLCAQRTHAQVLKELEVIAAEARERLQNTRTYEYERMDHGTVRDLAYFMRCLLDELELL